MALLKAVIGIFFAAIIIVAGGFLIYENFMGKTEKLAAINYIENDEGVGVGGISNEIKQFYNNMRFNHNQISYYINKECSSEKQEKMMTAFSSFSSKVNNIISFYPGSEDTAEILVGCSADSYEKEENIFIAGEGGPTRIVNSSMPVITRGKILLYNESRASCDEPLLEMHELIHVLGYDHINKSGDIMYPFLDCEQKVSQGLAEHVIKLYSIAPFADISFNKDAVANLERYAGAWYLNFNISIDNMGIINAENTKLEVYSKSEKAENLVHTFDLKTAEFGAGKNFYVVNLKLPSEADTIKLKLTTATKEKSTSNNVLELAF